MTISDVVDAYWAGFFRIEVGRLRSDNVIVTDPPGMHGSDRVFLLQLGDACIVGAPPSIVATIRDSVAGRSRGEVFDAGFAASLVPGGAAFGPSLHSYVEAATFRPRAGGPARRLGDDDAPAVERFREAVDDAEWAEGGFGPDAEVLWGIFGGDDLVAMGNMTGWQGDPNWDVGLVTHPAHRRRGLGATLASAMVTEALRSLQVVRYRALETNTASLRLAAGLGFQPYGANIVVRPA